MALDLFKNFAKVTVSIGYDASATSIALTAGHGTRLPVAPFNATWWNSTDYPDPSDDPNVEIVRVTAIASDTLTVTRAQESTSASAKNTASKTYKLIAGLTAKTLNADLAMLAIAGNGRLTLESGMPITLDSGMATINPTIDMVDKTTIYFSPYQGNRISLYDGANWVMHTFSELSLPLGTLVANTNYDVFLYDNSGTLTLELSAAWADATTRTNLIVLQDGIYVKAIASSRRYVGTFRTTAATTTEDSILKRFVWNANNRVRRELFFLSMVSHSYDGGNRQWNSNPNAQIAFVSGLVEDAISVGMFASTSVVPATSYNIVGLGLDSTTTFYRDTNTYALGQVAKLGCVTAVAPQMGYHALVLIQSTISLGAVTFESGSLQAAVAC
jgi:hypothetical protein